MRFFKLFIQYVDIYLITKVTLDGHIIIIRIRCEIQG